MKDLVATTIDKLDVYDYIYPKNYEEEKQAFFDAWDSDEAYNPQYRYKSFNPGEVERLLQQIAAQVDGPLEERLLAALRGRKRLIAAIGSDTITERSTAVYGSPSAAEVADAKDAFADGDNSDEEKTVSSETLQEAYHALFDQLDMEYSCRLVDAEVVVNKPGEQAIHIPEDGTWGVMQAQRALIHESTHAVRTYNGRMHGNPALIYGTDGYEAAEEGLPTFNEDAVGVFADTRPRITSRVIAIANADKSFYELYQLMREYGLNRRLAFIRTYRVKRGLQDTAQAGGFIKDHIYFQGYQRLTQQPELADRLYVGKIGFDEADMVKEAPAVTRDDHLAAYREVADCVTT